MSPNLDQLLDSIVSISQIEQGVAPALVSARGAGRAAILARPQRARRNNTEWTEAEDAFLRQHHGTLSEAEIGAALGRTPAAVRIRWKRELRLTPPSRNPSVLTAEHVAMGLGVDGKSVHMLMDRGRLPSRRLPSDAGDVCRVIERRALLAWIVNPEHWCYFDPQRVGAKRPRGRRGFTSVYEDGFWEHARRLVLLRLSRWEDSWLMPGQVARLLGIHHHIVNREILAGRLPATRWGNWRVKRSALLSASLNLHQGAWTEGRPFTAAAERFMLLASAVGLVPQEIAPLMGMKAKYIEHRVRTLHRSRRLKAMAKQLPIGFRAGGIVFADWRAYAGQFPRLARIMRAFAAGESLPRSELGIVRGVLHAYAAWHASSKAHHAIEKRLRKFGGRHTAEFYHHLVDQMLASGLGDPLRETKQGGMQ